MDLFEKLSEKQIEAVKTIDEDLEIIACAGAGKTGVVTRRIINILKEKPEVKPENIVAFTFTKKAAGELKSRIYDYGKKVLGSTEGFANMYIGTIHGFCIRCLQDKIHKFQKYSVLDEIKTKLFVERYNGVCGRHELDLVRYTDTNLFISVMSLLNENWKDKDKWDSNVQVAFEKYKSKMYENKYFDYSLMLQEMIIQLEENTDFYDSLADKIKYLIVDEYQDINPIQEKLINIIKGMGANICIVGDDDQTIYQFRGSDVNNILTFKDRYDIDKYIVLDTDYRSTRGIVDLAERVIINNNNRLSKKINSGCLTEYDIGDMAYAEFADIEEEMQFIAGRIKKLHEIGVPYSEMAVLLRKKKINSYVVAALEQEGIPFIVEGVNDLFNTKECKAAKAIFDYLNGTIGLTDAFKAWMDIDYVFDKKELSNAFEEVMSIDVKKLKLYSDLNLQQIYQNFLDKACITEDGRVETEVILYNLGKFSQVIGDFEIINFTMKPSSKIERFCKFMDYSAKDFYPEGYLTNSYTKPDAVSIMTVHQSKGLEYAAIFIPQLNKNFFPSQKVGGRSIWHIINKEWISDADRFDDSIENERKLFYVAVTRSKKYLYLTRSKTSQSCVPSVFLDEARDSSYLVKYDGKIEYNLNNLPNMKRELTPLELNFSILEDYFECPYRFKISMFYGFVSPISPSMGYGNVMHEIVHNIHTKVLAGEKVDSDVVNDIVEESFYLPYATPILLENMHNRIKENAQNYYKNNKDEFDNILMSEAQIEIDMGDGISVNGRIDLVKKVEEDGEKTVIVDFKSANKTVIDSINTNQLKIYALGYKELTGNMADYMEIYQLDSENKAREKITDDVLNKVNQDIRDAAENIRNNNLPKMCSKEKCSECYHRKLCLDRKQKKEYEVK